MRFDLNKPFPFIEKTQDKIRISFLFGLFIYFFLIVFQPFGLSNISHFKPLFIFGYSIITFVVMTSSLFFRSLLLPSSDKEIWTIKKMFNYSFLQIFIISIFNWLYTIFIGDVIAKEYSFLKFIFITIAVGSIPVLFSILLLERYLSTKNESKANTVTSNLSTQIIPIQKTLIEFGNQQNKLVLDLANLLCVKAEGNYVEIYSLENDLVKTDLIRSSLSKIKKQLEIHTQIKHCHRSFIVNTEYLEKVTGNARNFNLHLHHIDFTIPVSRNFPIDTIK